MRDRRPCRPGCRAGSWILGGALLASLASGTLACASAAPQPVKARPEAVSEPATQPAEPAAASREKALETAREPEKEPERSGASAVVVEPGGGEEGPGTRSLVEAARAERERRSRTGKRVAVITDKNVQEYASKGQITVAAPTQREGGAGEGTEGDEPGVAGDPVRDEQYWRQRGLEIRVRWREAAQEAEELDAKAAELRQRFYAEDDPYVRDGQIKPEWDRTLDRLQQARLEAELAQHDLTSYLEDGRQAGAYPGWLSEGNHLEPERLEIPSARPTGDAIEPPILQEDRDGDGDGDGDGV